MYMHSPYGVDPIHATNTSQAKDNLFRLWQDPSHNLRLCFRGDKFVGWLLSRHGRNCYHSSEISIEQLYYVTTETGFSAVRVLKALHDDLEALGHKFKVSTVQSHASHLDTDLLLCKILEKSGWSVTGYVAYKRIAPAGAQVGSRGATWGSALSTPMA